MKSARGKARKRSAKQSGYSWFVKTLAVMGGMLVAVVVLPFLASADTEWKRGSYLVQTKAPRLASPVLAQVATGFNDAFALYQTLDEVGVSSDEPQPYARGDDACAHFMQQKRFFRFHGKRLGMRRAKKLLSQIEACDANFAARALLTPNDPKLGDLWGIEKIRSKAAWDLTTGSSSVVIGVIDTGIYYWHPDLASNMWVNGGEVAGNGVDDDGNGVVDDVYGAKFWNGNATGDPLDDHSHGTHCAGTIGGVGNNSTGVVGVAWNVQLMALKFLSNTGSGSLSDAVNAINYAVYMKVNKGVNLRALSNSWGGGGYSAVLRQAIENAKNADIVFVAAAGNSGQNSDVSPMYPAAYDNTNIISVAATDSNDALASFSNYGATSVDVAAPGVAIVSTVMPYIGSYASYSGTSMATPHVSGVLALMFARNPSLTGAQVISNVLNTVTPLAGLAGKVKTGGRLDAYQAVVAMGGGASPTPTVSPTATPTAVPTGTPTPAPTATPTAAPTAAPTQAPTAAPTQAPTQQPSPSPTQVLTVAFSGSVLDDEGKVVRGLGVVYISNSAGRVVGTARVDQSSGAYQVTILRKKLGEDGAYRVWVKQPKNYETGEVSFEGELGSEAAQHDFEFTPKTFSIVGYVMEYAPDVRGRVRRQIAVGAAVTTAEDAAVTDERGYYELHARYGDRVTIRVETESGKEQETERTVLKDVKQNFSLR